MSRGRTSVLVIGAVTAFGFGVWTGPHLTGRGVGLQADMPYLAAAELPAQEDPPVAAATLATVARAQARADIAAI